MMYKTKIQSAILTILLFIIWGMTFGFHYGWVDDIQDLNVMKGAFVNGCSIFDPDHFILIQNILKWLYALAPKFPWYGSMLYTLLAYCIFSIFEIIGTYSDNNSIATIPGASLLFVIIFLLQPLNAVNFTEIAILTAGVSLLNCYFFIENRSIGWSKLILLLMPWFIALLIRKEVVFYISVIMVSVFVFCDHTQIKKFSRPIIVLLITSVGLQAYDMLYYKQTQEQRHITASNAYVTTIQDAYQINKDSIRTAEDSLLIEAVQGWNSFDKYKTTPAFLKKVAYSHPLQIGLLLNLTTRVKMLIAESVKYKGYHEIYNWNLKLLLVLIINLCLVFTHKKRQGLDKLKILSAHFVFWLSLLAIGVFVKMEDRFLFPVCMIYTLINLLQASRMAIGSTKKMLANSIYVCLLFTSAGSCAFMVYQNVLLADELNNELSVKRAYWAELARLKNKTIVYDFHSLFLLHDTPFREVSMPANNENVIANHYFLSIFDCMSDYYANKIGSDSIDSIISYLHSKREDVYMCSTDYDIDFLQRYMHATYHKDYSFYKDNSFIAPQRLKHNYIWIPLNFAVYRFKD